MSCRCSAETKAKFQRVWNETRASFVWLRAAFVEQSSVCVCKHTEPIIGKTNTEHGRGSVLLNHPRGAAGGNPSAFSTADGVLAIAFLYLGLVY